jgi:hypothetical protein
MRAQQQNSSQCPRGHIALNPRCQQCRSLKSRWDRELRDSGFIDIEQGSRLINPHTTTLPSQLIDFQSLDAFRARVSYYQWARSVLNTGRFDSKRDRLIWEEYSEGMSSTKISKKVGLERSYVTRKVHKIQHSLVNQIVGSVSMSQKLFFSTL